jgi:hypothetical protein
MEVTEGLLKRSIFAPYKFYNSVAHGRPELEATLAAFEDTVKSLAKGARAAPGALRQQQQY